MAMGRRQKLKTGEEYDYIYARRFYCYLCNPNNAKKSLKRQLNKRYRRELKANTREEFDEWWYDKNCIFDERYVFEMSFKQFDFTWRG